MTWMSSGGIDQATSKEIEGMTLIINVKRRDGSHENLPSNT